MNQNVIKAYKQRIKGQGRSLTLAEAETEIALIVMTIARAVGPTYRFGYHTDEDMVSQAILEAMKAIEKGAYDATRPLENFLHVHMKNRLSNYKRKHYARRELPCKCCTPETVSPCKKWVDWDLRNTTKKNLMRPLDVSAIADEGGFESTASDDAVANELESLIDERLPVELRADYRRMRDSVIVPENRRTKVREAVTKIAREAGYLDGDPDAD